MSGNPSENQTPESGLEKSGMNIAMILELAEFFKILSEPVRLELLLALRERELTVGDLTSLTGTTTANVSKHLTMMKKAGLLERRKVGTLVYYSLRNETVFGICDCICNDIRSRYEDKRSSIAIDQSVDNLGVQVG